MEVLSSNKLQRLPTPNLGLRDAGARSSTSRENVADRTSRNSRSATVIASGSSSRAKAGLTRHNVVLEPNEYGRRAADPTDSRENPYSDA